jgi:hypothetical protein
MLHTFKSIFFVLLLTVLFAGCAAPTPAAVATVEVPTSTSQPPTEAAPTATSTPGISGVEVSIPASDGAYGGTVSATITGTGDIGVIMANLPDRPASAWAPLIDALDDNENLRIVTFEYRDKTSYSTDDEDIVAVQDYLQAEGIQKTICIGGGPGNPACAVLRDEPEIIGMVLIATEVSAIDSSFPKLFLTADSDPFGLAGSTQRAYEQSAEPKEFKSYVSGRSGTALFTDPNVGPQVLADIVDFINGILSAQ